jgi:hypothetical protein
MCELQSRPLKYESLRKPLPCEPKEGLFKIVVGFGRDVVVLEVLLPVEHDAFGLHLSVLDVHLRQIIPRE